MLFTILRSHLRPYKRLLLLVIALQSVQIHRPTLDDVFLTMTGRSLREDTT